MIAEYDQNDNTLLRKFVYGPGIDEPICMIDVADGNAIYCYHYDGLGSVGETVMGWRTRSIPGEGASSRTQLTDSKRPWKLYGPAGISKEKSLEPLRPGLSNSMSSTMPDSLVALLCVYQ